MENKSTNPSKGRKSAKIPPPRGQIIIKACKGIAAAVAPPKNSKAKVQADPDEGGNGGGSGSGNGGGSGGGSN